MDVVADVLIAGLATWQIVEVLHHSKLTLPLNTWASKTASAGGLRGFIAYLIRCPFCMSHWVAAAVVLQLVGSRAGWWPYTEYVVWAFAVARLANLGNDLTYELNRGPKIDPEDDGEITVEDGPADERL